MPIDISYGKHLDIVRLFIEKLSDAILPDEYDADILIIEYLEYKTILWMKLV